MDEIGSNPERVAEAAQAAQAILDNLGRVVHAPDETLRLCVLCLISEAT